MWNSFSAVARVAVLVAGAATLVVSPVTAQQASTNANSGPCFGCVNGSGNNGCPVGTHDDFFFFDNTLTGDFHSRCAGLSCQTWLGDGHIPYVLVGLVPLREALESGSNQKLLRVFREQPGLSLNSARNAIQMIDENGQVLAHVRIAPKQAEQLQSLLAMSGSGAGVESVTD